MEQKEGPGAKRSPRPNKTDQNTKSNLIWVKFGTREFTKSIITNLDHPPTQIKIQKSKIADKKAHFGFIINLLCVISNFLIIRTLLCNICLLVIINNKVN